MSESNRPTFQFYVKDFTSGTADMSPAEVGCYIRLLCKAWDSNPCATIPDDDDKIRRITGADKEDWEKMRSTVMEKFEEDERFPGRLVNKRLRLTHEEADEHKEKMVERAKKGAAKRWTGKPKPPLDDEDDA